MNILITKVGNRVKIVNDELGNTDYLAQQDVILRYIVTDSTILLTLSTANGQKSHRLPIARVSVAGVVITNQSVFDTQVALVFP